jgi:hypothetical protein
MLQVVRHFRNPSFRAGRIPLVLILMATSLGLWIVCAKLVVPPVIESAYRGQSWSSINSMIRGQAAHSLNEYLQDWDRVTSPVLLAGLGFWLVVLVLSCPLSWHIRLVAAAYLVQIVLATKSVWLVHERINSDAVSYIRIAQYYLRGQTDLMVSGVWGPLLSWLILPWLLLFDDPLLAAHAAVAVSAVIFLFGCFCILRAVRLPAPVIVIGTWIALFLSVAWSEAVITPDLLMAGLFCCGTSLLLSGRWVTNARTALGAGVALGLGYLAKAVVLPAAALMIIALAGTHVAVYRSTLRQTVHATAIFVVGFLIVAGPWIGILSYKYRRPVFSTTGPIQHAIVGPPDTFRYHPDQQHFYKPEPGRISTSEDPTYLPYKYWSPFEHVTYAVHQLRLIRQNAHTAVQYMKSFDWFGLGLISAIFGYLLATPWRRSLREEPWRLSFIPIVSVTLIYLPVYAGDLRYYWVTFPFLMAASFGFVVQLLAATSKQWAVQRALALALVTLSLVMGNESAFLAAFSLTKSSNPVYLASRRLANELRASGLVGPLAAAGEVPVDDRYVAYFLNVQSFGWIRNVTDADPEAILSSGTSLIIVPRSTTLAKELRKDPRFTSADKQLFGCGEANGISLEVFLTRPLTPSDACPGSGPR